VRTPPVIYLYLIPLIVLISSCKESESDVQGGKIDFEITYKQERVGGFATHMLPQQMTLEYKEDLTRNTIEAGLGFFRLVNVYDLGNLKNTTYLKFIDKKYIYEGKKREAPCCFGKLEGMQLEFTGKTRKIAGFACINAVATFPDDGIEPFDIWFTEEIPLDRPNGNSPFRDIPGVMLEFNTLLGDVSMHVKAVKYEAVGIRDSEFEPPSDYRPVTKAEMEKIIHALLD
jgi:GLPGLI family protein